MQIEHLQSQLKFKRKSRRSSAVRLCEPLRAFVDGMVEPRCSRYAPLAEVWAQLLPQNLAEHTRIVDLGNGQLTVAADLPAYAYELRMCSGELLDELQQQCPAARVRRIKVVVGV